MRIYSMTATFGKLSNQTLTLQPGLNVITAPNEWGKSTWCAFLVAMLYGIDTKERTTATALAVKERYAPWSGEPMSGRIDLCWEGRDITIERSTKGRVPFGEFRAYETGSGLPIPQLTAANCGQMLLGVEKSVFLRAGFVRLTDMPVTQDEALRRRLNALVTTGDESGTGDALAQKLRDLRNKCRHNKTGLLPQAEAQRDSIQLKLTQLQNLKEQALRIQARQADTDAQIRLLENHRIALAYEASQEDARKVAAAQESCKAAESAYQELEARCLAIPTRDTAEDSIVHLEQLRMEQEMLQEEILPTAPAKPEVPAIFTGMTPEQALQQTRNDKETHNRLSKTPAPLSLILAIAAFVCGVALAFVDWRFAPPFPVCAVFFLIAYFREKNTKSRELQMLTARYPGIPAENWIATAQRYSDAFAAYAVQEAAYRTASNDLLTRKAQLLERIESFTQGESINACIDGWREVIDIHNSLTDAYERWQQAKHHAQALADMAKLLSKPELEDSLNYTAAETERLLAQAAAEHRQLHLQLGQCMGQIDTLGQEDALQVQLQAVTARIAKLEDAYSALTLAMDTLTEAGNMLQRKFAPRISQRAQFLFGQLTGGRYDRLQLTKELSLNAGAQGEVSLQEARWRSDGTIDQLYLALRLAVAEELTPAAPLVLDDALVRFDDTRLQAALEILKEAAQHKQVILFSCQGREQA